MALTQAQQERINTLSAAKDAAQTAYNNAVAAYTAKWNEAQACQRARDAKSTGIGKNQACHIDTLSRLNSETYQRENDRNTKKTILDQATAALDSAMREVQAETDLGQAALLTDPKFVLQAQQQATQANTAKAESDAKLFAQKTTWYLIAGVVFIAIVIFGIVIYKRYNK